MYTLGMSECAAASSGASGPRDLNDRSVLTSLSAVAALEVRIDEVLDFINNTFDLVRFSFESKAVDNGIKFLTSL